MLFQKTLLYFCPLSKAIKLDLTTAPTRAIHRAQKILVQVDQMICNDHQCRDQDKKKQTNKEKYNRRNKFNVSIHLEVCSKYSKQQYECR